MPERWDSRRFYDFMNFERRFERNPAPRLIVSSGFGGFGGQKGQQGQQGGNNANKGGSAGNAASSAAATSAAASSTAAAGGKGGNNAGNNAGSGANSTGSNNSGDAQSSLSTYYFILNENIIGIDIFSKHYSSLLLRPALQAMVRTRTEQQLARSRL